MTAHRALQNLLTFLQLFIACLSMTLLTSWTRSTPVGVHSTVMSMPVCLSTYVMIHMAKLQHIIFSLNVVLVALQHTTSIITYFQFCGRLPHLFILFLVAPLACRVSHVCVWNFFPNNPTPPEARQYTARFSSYFFLSFSES